MRERVVAYERQLSRETAAESNTASVAAFAAQCLNSITTRLRMWLHASAVITARKAAIVLFPAKTC